MNIVPRLSEHAALVGKTGSGKTTTAVALCSQICRTHPLLIFDTKGDRKFDRLPGTIIRDPDQLTLDRLEIYRPDKELASPDWLDSVLSHVYDSGQSLYVYADEVGEFTRPGSSIPPMGLRSVLQRGRERFLNGRRTRISFIAGTQRPARVPFIVFSEATHFYVHRLQTLRDRKTITEHLGDKVMEEPLAGHEFWYYSQSMAAPRKLLIGKEWING